MTLYYFASNETKAHFVIFCFLNFNFCSLNLKFQKFVFSDSKLTEGAYLSKISYEDPIQVHRDANRVGLGEQGKSAQMANADVLKKKNLMDFYGFDALLSESIALDRALTDIRHYK